MDEQAVWAVVPGVSAVAAQLTWLEPAYVYLERVPRFPLTTQQKRDGIRLELYNPALVVDDWERGRIFDAQQELKWERRRAGMHVVYCGLHPPAGFQVVALNTVGTPVTTAYYLWGERVREEDLEKRGTAPGTQVFVEGQIPRILHYPVAAPKQVQVLVREFHTADGGLCYVRWCGLKGT